MYDSRSVEELCPRSFNIVPVSANPLATTFTFEELKLAPQRETLDGNNGVCPVCIVFSVGADICRMSTVWQSNRDALGVLFH